MLKHSTTIMKPQDLSEIECREMADLYLAHYDASSEDLFLSDLRSKTEVLIVRGHDELIGFTTLEVFTWKQQGRTFNIVYSGDTIVDSAYWGQQALAFAWIKRMGEIRRQHPDLPLYWLLIVKGHRTFKYLPTFGRTFYPHWADQNDDLRVVADALAREKFGSNYNPQTGVVEFAKSRGQLKADIAEPTEAELRKECVRFFLKRNPNYRIGHELVCLCELVESNMKPLTKRIFTKSAA